MDDIEIRLADYFAAEEVDAESVDRVRAAVAATPRRSDRLILSAVAAVVLAVAVVSLLLTRHGHNDSPVAGPPTSTSATDTPTPSTTDHGSLTDREFAVASSLVRAEMRKAGAHVARAVATVSTGRESTSNTGHHCTSGTLLHIDVFGRFDNIVTSGPAGPAASSSSHSSRTSDRVNTVVITADPFTGKACLEGVRSGPIKGDPMATVVYPRRSTPESPATFLVVPTLTGLKVSNATAVVLNLGLRVKVQHVDASSSLKGVVITQSPPRASHVVRGSTIMLVVAS